MRAPPIGAPVSIQAARPTKGGNSRRSRAFYAGAGVAACSAIALVGIAAFSGEAGAAAWRLYVAAAALTLPWAGCVFFAGRAGGGDRAAPAQILSKTARTPEAEAERRAQFEQAGGAFEDFTDNALAQLPARLAAALEIAGRSIDAQSESMRLKFETAAAGAGVALGQQAQGFVDRLGREQAKLTEALELYGQSITSRLNLASVGLAREFRDSGEQLIHRVEAASGVAASAILRQGDAAAAAIQAQLDLGEQKRAGAAIAIEEGARALEDKLREATASIDRLVEGALQRIESRIEGRLGELGAALTAADRELDQQWSTRRDGLAAELAEAASGARVAISAAAAEVARAGAEAAESAKLAFDDRVGASLRDWNGLAESAARQLDAAADRAVTALSRNETALADRVAAFEANFASRTEILRETLALTEATLERGAAALATAGRSVDDAFGEHLREAQTRLGEWREGAAVALASHVQLLDQRAQEDAARFASLTERHSASLGDAFDGHHAALERNLASAISTLQDQLAARERETVVDITAAAHGYADRLLGDLRTASETLQTQGQALRDGLTAKQNEVADAMRDGVAESESRFVGSLEAAVSTLDGLARRLDSGLEERGQAIAQTLAQAAKMLLETLSESARETRASLDDGVAEAADAFDTSRRTLVAAITSAAQDGANALTSGVESQRAALEARLAEMTRLLDATHTALTDSITRAAAQADQLLTDRRLETTQAFETGSAAAARTIDEARERLLASLVDTAQATMGLLVERGHETRQVLEDEAARASRRLEESRSALAGAATSAAERFAAQFNQQLLDLQLAMEGGSERIQREFATPLGENLARIEKEGAELAAATRALAASFAGTASAHRDQLHQSFAREADALATQVASNAETFRRAFEATIAGADEIFLSRGQGFAESVAARIGELRTLVERDGPALVTSLDALSGQLSQQVEAASQRSLGDFERKATGLISLLTRRGDDLLSAMAAASSESTRKASLLTQELEVGSDRAGASLRQMERKVGAMLSVIDQRAAEMSARELLLPQGEQRRSSDLSSVRASEEASPDPAIREAPSEHGHAAQSA